MVYREAVLRGIDRAIEAAMQDEGDASNKLASIIGGGSVVECYHVGSAYPDLCGVRIAVFHAGSNNKRTVFNAKTFEEVFSEAFAWAIFRREVA
jgi:hypothetical protein